MEPFEAIGFSGQELIQNLLKHGHPRPLVVLLKKAKNHWSSCRCGTPILSQFSQETCSKCFHV